MEKGKTAQYRERLDKTLASPELTNEETLKTLLKNQLLHSSLDGNEGCSENVVERKTTEVSYFLGMLRSATSNDSQGEWKLKQDTEEFRVMYREGPHGTPFHSLLVEGFVEAPADVCLCVSWESALYSKWFPQYIFPQFKIVTCNCLKKVRIGEEISLVRVKVPWPMSSREAVVHFFLFNYFQDGLLVVLMNSISDLKSIDKATHGFTDDGIPEAKDVVRIDVVGGFALQKVTEKRSFFRTIANMDIKLDIVPPSLINFISRQLVGNGFKLYQKAVASVSSYNEDYSNALEGPLYTRIREALYSVKESGEPIKAKELKNDVCILPEKHFTEGRKDGQNKMEQKVNNFNHDGDSFENNAQVNGRNVGEIEEDEHDESTHLDKDAEGEVPKHLDTGSLQNDVQVRYMNNVGEIEEVEIEESICSDENDKDTDNKIPHEGYVNVRKTVPISSGVEQALETLEKAIYMVRKYGFNIQTKSFIDLTPEKPTNTELGVVKDTTSSEDRTHPDVEIPKTEDMEKKLQESRKSTGIQESRHSGSNSYLRDGNYNRIAPASLEDYILYPVDTNEVAVSSSQNETLEIPNLDKDMHKNNQKIAEANFNNHEYTTIDERRKLSQRKKKLLCCFFINSA